MDRSGIGILLAALVFAAAAVAVFSFPPHHDIAWLLYAAGRVLDGADLYTDVIEVNPPLIVWISALAEAAARLTGAWPTTTYRAIVLVLATLSLLLCHRILRFRLADESPALPALTILLAWLLVGLPAINFGQREHLAVLLTLPWLLALAGRVSAAAHPTGDNAAGIPSVGRNWPSQRSAIALGVLAGIGFALKPFFLLAWLLPEALLLRRAGVRAMLRPETVALLATVTIYGVAVLLLEPDYVGVARLAAISYEGYYPTGLPGLLRQPGARIGLISLALWLGMRPFMVRRAAGDVLALAIAGFLAGVFVQGKGWDYHWIASTTLSWLLLATIAVRVLDAGLARKRALAWLAPALATAVVGAGLALSLATVAAARQQALRSGLSEFVRVANAYAEDGSLVVLSTQMPPAFPLVNYIDARWGLRFNSLWPLPGLYPPSDGTAPFRYRSLAEMPPAERYLFRAVASDLTSSRPGVLIVDRNAPGGVLHGFDYLEYLARHPDVARLLQEYSEVQPIGPYRVLVRTARARTISLRPAPQNFLW